MISCVFAHADLPCRGRFALPGGREINVKISHLSRERCVVAWGEELPTGEVFALHIQFPDGSVHSAMAQVSRSGSEGLFLIFEHGSESSAAAFGARLIVAAEEYRPEEGSSGDEEPAEQTGESLPEGRDKEPPEHLQAEETQGAETANASRTEGYTEQCEEVLSEARTEEFSEARTEELARAFDEESMEPLTAELSETPEDLAAPNSKMIDSGALAEPGKTPEPAAPSTSASGGTVPESNSTSDIRSSILERTRTVDSRKLAAKKRELRVVNMSTITALIEDSLTEALAASDRQLDAAAREALLRETESEFAERLASLQAEKAGAEAQAEQLRAELERAEATLAEEREREISTEQFTVSEAGIQQLDKRLGRLIDQSLRAGAVDPQVEEQMRAIVAKLLDDEREKIRERAQEAQSDAISLLERKVGRLAQTLQKSETAREIAEHRAAALEAAGGNLGIKSVVDAGLHPEDPSRDRKLALLQEIVKENDAVRAFIQSGQAAEAPVEPEKVGGVKKISVKRVKPPPLLRSESSEPEANPPVANGATTD